MLQQGYSVVQCDLDIAWLHDHCVPEITRHMEEVLEQLDNVTGGGWVLLHGEEIALSPDADAVLHLCRRGGGQTREACPRAAPPVPLVGVGEVLQPAVP